MTDQQRLFRSHLTRATIAAAALCGLGLTIALRIKSQIATFPISKVSVFHVLLIRNDIYPLVLTLLSILGFSILLYKGSVGTAARSETLQTGNSVGWRSWLLLAVAIAALTSGGAFFITLNYPLSLDEYLARFQATLFASGHLTAPVPAAWQPWGFALAPITLPFKKSFYVWVSTYLPVWAGILSIFEVMKVPWLANPLLAAGSLLLFKAIRKNADQAWKWDPWIAATVLATSCQFLMNAMTYYAMNAHLFFNLLWLWFFTLPHRRGFWLAAWVGFLAIGLHQPVVHLVFAFPFLFRLLRERAWSWSCYYLFIYGGALICYSYWYGVGSIPETRSPGHPVQAPYMIYQATQFFGLPSLGSVIIEIESLAVAIAWSSPLGLILFLFAVRYWERWPPLARDLLYSIILTLTVYFLFKSDQGHGWGYRYDHSVLGNFALIAAMGFEILREQIPRADLRQILWLNAAVVFLVFFPLRAWQVETFVAPFSRAEALIRALPDRYIILDTKDIWYGADLVRNDSQFKNFPLVFLAARLDSKLRDELRGKSPVRVVTSQEFAGLGLKLVPENPPPAKARASK